MFWSLPFSFSSLAFEPFFFGLFFLLSPNFSPLFYYFLLSSSSNFAFESVTFSLSPRLLLCPCPPLLQLTLFLVIFNFVFMAFFIAASVLHIFVHLSLGLLSRLLYYPSFSHIFSVSPCYLLPFFAFSITFVLFFLISPSIILLVFLSGMFSDFAVVLHVFYLLTCYFFLLFTVFLSFVFCAIFIFI